MWHFQYLFNEFITQDTSVRSANLFDPDAYAKFTVKIDDPPAYQAASQSTAEAASPTEVSN